MAGIPTNSRMNYSRKFKEEVAAAPKNLGVQLLTWAIHRQFSIIRVSACIGTTRQAIYNWGRGAEVSRAYRSKVVDLIQILRFCDTADSAWTLACNKFKLNETDDQ